MVLPVQKNHNRGTDLTNYWPFSNLTFFSKLLEKVILNQLWNHLKTNNLLPNYQSGYRANHSTETAILNLCDNILKNMEKNINTAMVALDLSAAFDTVNHTILLEVLNKYYGIHGLALQWIKSYLTNRQFRVQIEDKFSEVKTIDFSVTQGSILGPILFICYANTLQELFTNHNSLSRYADDPSFIKSFLPIDHNILSELELDIKNISDWMYQNHLEMNNAKIEFITFGSRSRLKKQYLSEIKVGNEVVKSLETIRFLGITLDKDLEMKKFIATKVRNAYLNIKRINKIRKFLTEDETKILMYSKVLSHLDNGISILVNLPKSTVKPLQSIQNYTANIICKKQKYDSSTGCLYKLHWLPIHYRCIYKLMTIMYKMLEEQEPQYLVNKLSFKTSIMTTRNNTSNSKQLLVPFNRKKTLGDRGFSFPGPHYWNQLSNNIKEAENFGKFKKLLKTHFLNYLLNNSFRLNLLKLNFKIFTNVKCAVECHYQYDSN